MNNFNKILIVLLVVLGTALSVSITQINHLKGERNTYKSNTDALLSDMKRIRLDSATSAVDVKVLKLTLDEYKHYREKDLDEIKKLKIKLKNIQAIAKHNIEIDVPVNAIVRDSLVIRDTILLKVQTVEMRTPHIEMNAIIENNKLTGRIHLPVNLNQIVWIEYKHRFLWWRWGAKSVHQTISVDNPYVKINYSEAILLHK